MQTKKDEIIITSSDLSELAGKYLSERLLRKWNEDFADEDTGETVTVERKEILFDVGTHLDSKVLSEINFFLQSGDIDFVTASNQQRNCRMDHNRHYAALWQVQILLNGKKKTLFLYAKSVENAMEIATDFVEQTYIGWFKFVQLKELDYSNLLYDEDPDFAVEISIYKLEIEMLDNGDSYTSSYVVQGTDAENCKIIINTFIVNQRISAGKPTDFELTIISAKTIPCHQIIDPEFCKIYFEKEEAEQIEK